MTPVRDPGGQESFHIRPPGEIPTRQHYEVPMPLATTSFESLVTEMVRADLEAVAAEAGQRNHGADV